jgi:hypothetical protein
MAWARDENLNPPLDQALHLLLGGYAKDVLQLRVHPIHPVAGGHGQSVQDFRCHGHILASPSKGWTQ